MVKSIGEILKDKRIEKKISLEQVFKDIHIKIPYLEALESDQFDNLPSDVQGKGFLRIYANYLNLQIDPLMVSWDTRTPPIFTTQESSPPQLFTFSDGIDDVLSIPDESEFLQMDVDKPVVEDIPIPESKKIFLELGQTLKAQRERLSISLEDVEKYTRLKKYHITALESGDLDSLPSPIQARGMLGNYANFLQANPDQLLLRFAEGLQAQLVERHNIKGNTSFIPDAAINRMSGWRKLFTLDLMIGSLAILFLLVFSIWGLTQISSLQYEEIAISAPAISDMLQITPSEEVPQQITPTELVLSTNESDPNESAEEGDAEGDEEDPASQISTMDNAPIQLYVIAQQRALMKVVVDGTTEFDGRVTPGNAYPFSGREMIELTTGNAAALQVYLNQTDLGTLGFVGQVVQFQYTISGIVTPTPMFTNTPTPTPIPTLTLQPTPTLMEPTLTPTPIVP